MCEPSAYRESELSDPTATLKRILPETVINGIGEEEFTLPYILRHTQLLPRHLVFAMNEIVKSNRRAGGSYDAIQPRAVVTGIREAERAIVDAILEPFQSMENSTRPMLGAFLARPGHIISFGELQKRHRTIRGAAGDLDFPQFRDLLADIGVIGRPARSHMRSGRYLRTDFAYAIPTPLHFNEQDLVCIHPAFTGYYQVERSKDHPSDIVYPTGSDPDDTDVRSFGTGKDE